MSHHSWLEYFLYNKLPVLEQRKLRQSNVKQFAQSHRAGKLAIRDPNIGSGLLAFQNL